jgi:hypothetical protein
MAYNPADFELVEAPAGSASPYNPADFELVEAPEGSGFWRQAADLPVSAAGGVITGLKGMTDLFGANNPVSQELANYQEFYRQSLSPEAQADQQEVARIMQEAQDKGVWEQVKAGARAFAVAPLDTAAQSLGTMAPIVATGVAGRAFGLGAKGVQAVQAGAGAGMNTGIVKDSIYQDTKNLLLQSGKSEEEADRVALEAQSYGGQNIDQLLLAAGLGAADALFGAEKILGNAISKSGGRVTGGVVAGAIKTGVSEGISEAAQGGQEAMAPNIALQREGYAVPTMRGVASSATMEGLSGFMAGAPVGAAEGMAAPRIERADAPTMSVGPQPAPFTPPPAAETVVVEEVFGDATTAAAPVEEAAPAAEPAINPDDFEVVEMPGETIVTEPPAAPAFQFDLADDTTTAPDVDAEADVFSGVPQQQAPAVAAEPEVVAPVEAPVDAAPEPAAQPQPARAQAAPSLFTQAFRAAKKSEDKRLAVFKAVADGSIVASVIEAAESGKPLPSLEKFKDAFPYEGPALPGRVDLSKVAIKPIKPAAPDAAAKSHTAKDSSRFVLEGIYYDADAQAIVATDGRRMFVMPQKVEGESRIIASVDGRQIQGQFPNWKTVIPTIDSNTILFNVDIDKARRAGTVLSGINKTLKSIAQPAKVKVGMATLDPSYVKDAVEAIVASGAKKVYAASKDDQTPVMLRGDNGAMVVIMPLRGKTNDLVVDASTVIGEVIGNEGREVRQMFEAGNPNAPAKKSRARIKKMTAQSGAIDLSIVEDLFEYGKTIYRAGMSFGKWAGQMVKEFGQGIASFLKQVFDRIVQAYKDSPYSDTTGAVGDVRPKQKPRRFEQRVSQAENVSEQTRGMLGDDMYETIGLEPMADEARAWIAENGVDAAERRILALSNEKVAVTPLDFTIAQYLQVNLDAMGFHNRAATIARTISRRATSLGQTISVLKLFSRLSPEGIVQYANQVMDEHINSLPPERQAQIRADQQDMVNLEETIATTRKRTAEDSIINGTQGGEKIQDKLKRRIPDKGQKQGANVSIRSVLTSQATKAEATKQITQLLVENGISASEAAALANAITSRFYTVLEGARKSAAQASKPKSGKGKVAFDKLMTRLKNGEVSDQELLAELARMRGLPALTPAVRSRIQNLAKEVRTAPDEDVKVVAATKMFEEVHELVPPDFWSKVRTFRIIMMLFSPKTWIKNLGGNNVQWILNIGRDSFVNTVLDPVVSGFSGKRTAARAKTGRLRALLTPLSDLKKGYMWNKQNNPQANFAENSRAALEHLRVLAKLTTQNKFEMADIKDVGRRMFSDPFMGTLESALSIALGGPDRAYWMSAYRASLAQREAAAKANGEWTGRPSPEDVEGAQADAMAAIYQNKNSISDFGIGFRSKLNLFSMKALAKLIPGLKPTDQYGLGSMLLTFAQVPGAIARTAINWSPLGTINAFYEGMNGILWKASNERVGKPFDQAAFNKAFTEALGGSGIYVAGYWLYAMGIITASQEEDDDLEAMRKAMGMGQFSLNMSALKRMLLSGNIWEKQQTQYGDSIYKYDWVQPIAITFAAGAELAKMVEENDRNGIKKGLAGKAGMAALSLAAGAKSLEELPLLSGLSSFMKTWGNDSLLAAVTKTVAGEPSAFVPQLVRQANQLMDNTLRQTRGGDSNVLRSFNQLAANTPGVGDKYPPRMDITGTPMERYHRSGNTVFNVLINPAVATYAKTNPVFDEVQRLMSATGETRQLPREVKRAAKINGQNVDLTNEQLSAYQYYVGNYTMSTFNWRINNPGYLRLPDTEKVKMLAQDMEDIDAAVKSALFGHDIRRLTRRQRVMRNNLVNSPLGQSMPPR